MRPMEKFPNFELPSHKFCSKNTTRSSWSLPSSSNDTIPVWIGKRLRNILGKTPLEMCPFSRITLINGIYPLDKLNESSTVKFFFRCVKLFELKNGGELMQSFEIVRHFLFILQEHENEFPFLFFRNMKIVSFLFCRKMQINSAYDEINPRHKMNLIY